MKPSAEKVCKCLTFSGQLVSLPWYPVKEEENGYDCLVTGVLVSDWPTTPKPSGINSGKRSVQR